MSFIYRANNKGPRTVSWGTTDKTGAQSDFTPFTTTRCCHGGGRGVCFKCLFKIQYECVNLSLFITVVSWVSQLCPFLNACCLSDRSLYSSRWAMIFEHIMCSSNLQGTQVKETGRYLHASDLSLFLKRGQISARDHSFGISPVSIDWKRWANTGPNCC